MGAGFTIFAGIFMALQAAFPQSAARVLETGLAMLLIGFPLAAWRIYTIMAIFNDGFAVPATINSVFYFSGTGRVEYIYSFRGQKYRSGNTINKSRFTRVLESQVSVTVLIDGNNPKKAFIQELYT